MTGRTRTSEKVLLAVQAEDIILDNRVFAICDCRLHNNELGETANGEKLQNNKFISSKMEFLKS